MGFLDGWVVGMLTITLDPRHPLYLSFLEERGAYVTMCGRSPKRPTLRAGAEKRLSVKYVGIAWSRFVTYARRYEPRHECGECGRVVGGYPRDGRHGKGCRSRVLPYAGLGYFKAMELQSNGRAHLHVLLRAADVAAWAVMASDLAPGGPLHRMASDIGFGGLRKWRDYRGRVRSGVELERGRSREALARYVSKVAGSYYASGTVLASEVAKDRQQRCLPPRTRRASWSMGARVWAAGWVARLRSDSSLVWSFRRMAPERVVRLLSGQGVDVSAARAPAALEPVWIMGAVA